MNIIDQKVKSLYYIIKISSPIFLQNKFSVNYNNCPCEGVHRSILPLHVDEQRQDDQLEPIYNSSVPIQATALKTSQEQ